MRSFLQPPVRGVVLQSYGAGNGPDNRQGWCLHFVYKIQFLDILREITLASSRGVILVNISQCQQGSVSAAYEAGAVLEAAGVVQGADMTPEAALAKLSYILAIEGLTVDEKRRMLRMNLRGELTQPDMKRLSLSDNNFLTTVAASLRFESFHIIF